MVPSNLAVRAGGMWLATASILMIAVLVLHGPIAPNPNDQMAMIAHSPLRWAVAHWLAAASLSLYAVSGLIMLTSKSRLIGGLWTLTAWAVVTIGGLWTMTTAVAETTVVADAAASGSIETFEAWWAFSEGKANGFAFVALALAVVAGNEARAEAGVVPAWSAWFAAGAGLASFGGWALGMWFDLAGGSLLWVAASIAMSIWTLCFGVALARAPVGARAELISSV